MCVLAFERYGSRVGYGVFFDGFVGLCGQGLKDVLSLLTRRLYK